VIEKPSIQRYSTVPARAGRKVVLRIYVILFNALKGVLWAGGAVLSTFVIFLARAARALCADFEADFVSIICKVEADTQTESVSSLTRMIERNKPERAEIAHAQSITRSHL
jgi:hypothetical protein